MQRIGVVEDDVCSLKRRRGVAVERLPRQVPLLVAPSHLVLTAEERGITAQGAGERHGLGDVEVEAQVPVLPELRTKEEHSVEEKSPARRVDLRMGD